jgi:hypothetical protein
MKIKQFKLQKIYLVRILKKNLFKCFDKNQMVSKTSFFLNKNTFIKKEEPNSSSFFMIFPSRIRYLLITKSIGQLIIGRNGLGDNKIRFFTNSYTSMSV